VLMTLEVIKNLSRLHNDFRSVNRDRICRSVEKGEIFRNQKIVITTKLYYVHPKLLECIFNDLNCKVWYSTYPTTTTLIVNDNTYYKLINQDEFNEISEGWLLNIKKKMSDGKLTVYNEKNICNILDIPIVEKTRSAGKKRTSAKDIVPTSTDFDEMHPLFEKHCVFTGVLDRLDRDTAMLYVANVGGICQNSITKDTNYLVLGDNSYCSTIKDGKSTKQKKAEDMIAKGYDIKIIPESTFYQLLKNE
jgi:NAD-dependent DNA ligase